MRFAAKVAPNQQAARRPRSNETEERWATGKFLAGKPESPAKPWHTPAMPECSVEENRLDMKLAESFRHGGWLSGRKRVIEAMKNTPGISDRRASAFCLCGSDAYIEECVSALNGKVNEYRIRTSKCNDRFCVPCAKERSYRIRENLLPFLFSRKNLSLVTLTLLQTTAPLSETLDRITKAFRHLRTSPVWKKAVVGGVGIIEVKLNPSKTAWNVHYHVIAETTFMKQADLGAAWQRATGDSYIVDIRRVGAVTGAVQYVTKYVCKAGDHQIVSSPKHLSEALIAFSGRRLISTFGKWRGLKLSENHNEVTTSEWSGEWRVLGTLGSVLRKASDGDAKYADAASFIFARDGRNRRNVRGLRRPDDSS